jgi:hypothetical protein
MNAQTFNILAKKDQQIAAFEKTIRDLNASLAIARTERAHTIEAHQSRIKHLQDKYLNDIKNMTIDNVNK